MWSVNRSNEVDKYSKVLEREKEKGRRIDILKEDDRPLLLPENIQIWEMFSILSKTRRTSMNGFEKISLESIHFMLNNYNVYNCDERLDVIRLIVSIDDKFIGLVNGNS